MTDLEKFIELYRSVGANIKVEHKNDTGLQIIYLTTWDNYKNDLFDGYPGCYSTITFDKYGKFIIQGFWDD